MYAFILKNKTSKLFFLLLDYTLRFFVTPITYLTLPLIFSMRALNWKFVITNIFSVSPTFGAYFTVAQCDECLDKLFWQFLLMFFIIKFVVL